MVRSRVRAPAPDSRIVILDIDERSLLAMGKEFGRWPWPRDTLATALDFLEAQSPAAIVWDVLMADPDRLNPGGDASFNLAAKQSRHSHFSVVRLPSANDFESQITQMQLPSLWAKRSMQLSGNSTVALIAPFMTEVASAPLGFNNGYVDSDGVLRRHRAAEALTDGGILKSLPLSVLMSLNPELASKRLAPYSNALVKGDELISWRKTPDIYPRISFVDVFSKADRANPSTKLPNLSGKIIIIGSTAPSLGDIHPTPLSSIQHGVQSMATIVDNELNDHLVRELPRWLQAVLAIFLIVAIAGVAKMRSISIITPTLFILPISLIFVSYLSLNVGTVFLDLQLPAGLALVYLGCIKHWNLFRHQYWSGRPISAKSLVLMSIKRSAVWDDEAVDRLIDYLENYGRGCRMILLGKVTLAENTHQWTSLPALAAIIGPIDEVTVLKERIVTTSRLNIERFGEATLIDDSPLENGEVGLQTLTEWTKLETARYHDSQSKDNH